MQYKMSIYPQYKIQFLQELLHRSAASTNMRMVNLRRMEDLRVQPVGLSSLFLGSGFDHFIGEATQKRLRLD